MKLNLKCITSIVLTASVLLSSALSVQAAIPHAYWQYQTPFETASTAGDTGEIIRIGNLVMDIFRNEPASEEKTGILYNTYDKMAPAYQKEGNYTKAISCLQAQLPYAKQLGFTDAVMLIEARIRQIDPMTQVYALSSNGASVPFYGAKNEPKQGTYYGRVFSEHADAPFEQESAVSFYSNCLQEDLSAFDYFISPYADGKRLIHIGYNMPNENDSLTQVLQPSADAAIRKDMEYLGSLKVPVMLRIGGEMNVWNNAANAENFKNAYIKIANIARQVAPNVALVFSPNDISSWGVDINDFYPGDSYVDWVGVSLYTNLYRDHLQPVAGEDFEEMYYGVGAYANPITKLKEIVDRYGAKKPIMITEGGSGHSVEATGVDVSEFAKSRVNLLYTYVNMVFPQVKAVIYFDNYVSGENKYIYALNRNTQVKNQYIAATQKNPALIKEGASAPVAYVKAENYADAKENIQLYTYCILIGDEQVKVEYSLDGTVIPSTASIPYECNIAKSSLGAQAHELKVEISGAKGGYKETKLYTVAMGADGIVKIVQKQ